MNLDYNSLSSSDDQFDDMVNNMILYNAYLEEQEDYVIQQAVQTIVAPIIEATQRRSPKKKIIPRDRADANQRLMNDYFVDRPLYTEDMFRRRFRMRRPLFFRIMNAVAAKDKFFQQLPDATGKLGASTHQKCTAALRCLAYGSASDAVDEYIKIAESTAKECLVHFVQGIRKAFKTEYLRRPTVTDLQRLLRDGERRSFPGMMGSIDCMHWQWKNCPRAWKGLYQGRSKSATVIPEAVASGDLWIWHAFFGTPGTCNDINVLARSPVFDDLYQGRAPEVTFNVNGNTYNRRYYLTDGIYPKWAVFMPAIRLPLSPVDELFTKRQESVRKDVERAFGVLQARFAIIQRPSLIWDEHLMWEIMLACIILHNMIVEDERDTYLNYQDASDFEQENASIASTSSSHRLETFSVQPGRYNDIGMQQYLQRRADAWDRDVHNSLQKDLAQHIWHNCRQSTNDE
ncbi:uncharacterized protein LOC125496779 [Beta vulgaris subsp. vulgaris]|uniref:uncharacterized protein LOC125496779 n=1 Tax=Beta vulgaris subsp. vulgaris TaxID=3555 RepID=UPI002036967F|nr:uncharacterized protein LOC125496779 [Beta vulgaris subsp. vulgaris]